MTWESEVCPNDLGDNNHRWSWLVRANATDGDGKDILWMHTCNGKRTLCWIDITSGTKHQLISEEPLHIQPSILCPVGCGDHGYVREGKWVSA